MAVDHKMNKVVILTMLLLTGLISCKSTEKKIDKIEIASQYIKALDESDTEVMRTLLTDSLQTVETDYDYEQTFSKREYIEDWMKWDSVFEPTYRIIEIEQEDDAVKVRVSKEDKRIRLLHEGPTVWDAVIRFEANKIVRIENSNVVFNDKIWEQNRTKLLSWIDENHPELNGFLNGQNESAAIQYLKAIELYSDKE